MSTGLMRIKTAAESHEADYSLAKLLDQPGGLEKLALEQLPRYIKETRDYTGFARKILFSHTITSEEVQIINGEPTVYYSKDQNSHAAFYGDDSEIVRMAIEGDGVNVAINTISSDDTTLHLKRLLVQKYNYLERVRELSGQAVAKVEDKKLIELVETLLKGTGTNAAPEFDDQIVTVDSSEPRLLKKHLVDLRKTHSQHDVPCAAFVLNQGRIDDILLWAQEEIDQLTQREMLEQGLKYQLWGSIKLITSSIIDADVVYSFSEPELVGRMPILKDLTIMLTEGKTRLEKGLFMFEFVGFYLASEKAVGKLIMNFVTGGDKVSPRASLGEMARSATPATGYPEA